MATESKNSKGVQVSCTIPAELHETLENYRWNPAVRLTGTQVVRKALEEFAANHAETPAKGEPKKA